MRITHPSWDELKDNKGDLDPITLLRDVALTGTHPWELPVPPNRFMGMVVGKGPLPKKHSRDEKDEIKDRWGLDKKWFTDE